MGTPADPALIAHSILETDSGLRKLDRRVYTDPFIFQLEMRCIWERVWVYLGHESQLPSKGDFLTGHIGRQPIFINRNKRGEIRGFINACTHRGATLCRIAKGRTRAHTCPFHGWTFDLDGALVQVTDEANGGYPPSFDKQTLGLHSIPRLESYRGFIFGCLNSEVVSLQDYLGDASTFIDLLVDQSADGIEVIRGYSTYTYNGNWKLQAENGVDGYHVNTVHANYIETMMQRARSTTAGEKLRTMDAATISKQEGGYFDLGHGHTVIWNDWGNPENRAIYSRREEIAERIGSVRAKWAVNKLRNLLLYPSVFLMDQMSTQIRVIRPLTVDQTEITIYCVAPVGEAAADRTLRIRQYEDFFNASGMATPDDLSEFNASQKAFHAETLRWSELSRGAAHELAGPSARAEELHIKPASSGRKIADEGLYIAQHRQWMRLMTEGVEAAARGN